MKFIRKTEPKQILGFVITGLLSTLIMFCLYVFLQQMMNYQYAYLISYCISVIALYFMNAHVFKGRFSFYSFVGFPLIYLIQYLVGAASLGFIVRMGFPQTFAPLLVVVVLLPITYLLNLVIFSRN